MKKVLLSLAALLLTLTLHAGDGATDDFVGEEAMQADLLQMLADFSMYLQADFQPCKEPNSIGETCGCFRGENTMGADERGVRPNADLSMICAFLVKYAKPAPHLSLPPGVTWDSLEQMAMQSLVFAYSTHKANRLKPCAGGRYWGSVSKSDHTWESSLWAMSVAYSAFFQWERLSSAQRGYIYELLKAECKYELERDIPTGYRGDTKAEENGWEADVLAATLGLFPNDPLAPRWFQRLREFAINSYSQKDDANDATVIDPDYDQQTVAQLYRGQNLYDDYTLQNHNYFHTSYQNVVIQELGEAALALKLFQQELHGQERWRTNALLHNCDRVMTDVLYHLALPDGELAMPNGNDWSLFLYDQITSYTTNACFLRDPHALMLENRAYQQIKARQQTTADGAWLLRPDVGARRMGVQGHRVMMTWLMHHVLSTATLAPTTWADFSREFSRAKVFPSQNIVRASSPDRFVCFSWSGGLRSYTGYIAPFGARANNLIVPFRAHNTGNFLGWYEVEGRKTNAVPVVSGNYRLDGNAFAMNGELLTNDSALNHRFCLYASPGNAVVCLEDVRANTDCTVKREKGGLMAVSVDPFTSTTRTIYTAEGTQQLDGTALTVFNTDWLNIDNCFGVVTSHFPLLTSRFSLPASPRMAFGEIGENNSILTARLYAAYGDEPRRVSASEHVARRATIYYSNVDAALTRALAQAVVALDAPDGWSGIIAPDTQQRFYLLLSNFRGPETCTVSNIQTADGSPVFSVPTTITAAGSSATFTAKEHSAVTNTINCFITGKHLLATQDAAQPYILRLQSLSKKTQQVCVTAFINGQRIVKELRLCRKQTVDIPLN